MQEAARAAVALFRSRTRYEVPAANDLPFRVVYPLAAHAIEEVEASLVLIEAGMAYAAETNARTAFQHAVSAQWVALTVGGEELMKAEMDRQQLATLKDMRLATDLPDELWPSEEVPSSQGPARDFWRMCDRFSELKQMYVIYRVLSSSLHPSLGTMAKYLHVDLDADLHVNPASDGEGGMHIKARPGLEVRPDHWMILSLSAVLAVGSLQWLGAYSDEPQELLELQTRYGVPLNLAGSDREPQRQRPAAG